MSKAASLGQARRWAKVRQKREDLARIFGPSSRDESAYRRSQDERASFEQNEDRGFLIFFGDAKPSFADEWMPSISAAPTNYIADLASAILFARALGDTRETFEDTTLYELQKLNWDKACELRRFYVNPANNQLSERSESQEFVDETRNDFPTEWSWKEWDSRKNEKIDAEVMKAVLEMPIFKRSEKKEDETPRPIEPSLRPEPQPETVFLFQTQKVEL